MSESEETTSMAPNIVLTGNEQRESEKLFKILYNVYRHENTRKLLAETFLKACKWEHLLRKKTLGARTNGKRRKQCFRSNVSSFVAALTNAQDPAFAASKHIFERIFFALHKIQSIHI